MMNRKMIEKFIQDMKDLQESARLEIEKQAKLIGIVNSRPVLDDNGEVVFDKNNKPVLERIIPLNDQHKKELADTHVITLGLAEDLRASDLENFIARAKKVNENIDKTIYDLERDLRLLTPGMEEEDANRLGINIFFNMKMMEQYTIQMRILGEHAKSKLSQFVGKELRQNDDNEKMYTALFSDQLKPESVPNPDSIFVKLGKYIKGVFKTVARKINQALGQYIPDAYKQENLNSLLALSKEDLKQCYIGMEMYDPNGIPIVGGYALHQQHEREIRKHQIDFLAQGLALINQEKDDHQPAWAAMATKGLLLSIQYQLDKEFWPRLAESRLEQMITLYLDTPGISNIKVARAVETFGALWGSQNVKRKPLSDNPEVSKFVDDLTSPQTAKDVKAANAWINKRQDKETIANAMAKAQQPIKKSPRGRRPTGQE